LLNPREDSLSKGIALSVSASVLFAVMYYYTSLLTPLSGVEIFGWRMLLTVPCMTVFMIVRVNGGAYGVAAALAPPEG
jgi:chloramphenicol-sensitive protein RarD